jgi:hypothetical protein
MMSNELAVFEIKPVATTQDMVDRYNEMKQFVADVLREGHDFGAIPGTGDKPTLLKPGAEKLARLFGLRPIFTPAKETEDWSGADHNGEPFFYYKYDCALYKGDVVAGNGQGSCNSWEKKYRFRTAELVCPVCENSGTIIKGKEEYGGGWLCWGKKGGCGGKWEDGEGLIENQERGTVPNPNPADLVNTIQKMAQKRALVAAVLVVANASDFFTQDIEDMDFSYSGQVIDVEVKETTPTKRDVDNRRKELGLEDEVIADIVKECDGDLELVMQKLEEQYAGAK